MKKISKGVAALVTSATLFTGAAVTVAVADPFTVKANGGLRVRSGPGLNTSIIGRLPNGARIDSVGKAQNGWIPIRFGSGIGWVSDDYLYGATSSKPGAKGSAWTTTRLNVRSGAGLSYNVVTTLDRGTRVTTTGRTSGTWTQITRNGDTVWVSTQYLSRSRPGPDTDPGGLPKVRSTATARVALDVRDSTNSHYRALAEIPAGSKVSLTGTYSRGLAQIVWKGRVAWVNGRYLDGADVPTPPKASGSAATAIAFAKSHLGDRYEWGGNGPRSWDCSGLMVGAWRAAGVSLPRTSREQSRYGRAVSRSALKPGDLVFYYSPVSHVGLYVGNDTIIHAPRPGKTVTYTSVDSMPWAGARRVSGGLQP